jgi:2-keto-4-pentenoate hydratase/2-oxohepta-3-ene-1,7-dioic acid hydratase in catechol pathway
MKLITFAINNQKKVGILDDQFVIDPLEVFDRNLLSAEAKLALSGMTTVISSFSSIKSILNEAFIESKKNSRGRIPLSSVKILAPMLPSTILCSGSNYLSHNAEKANADISGKEPEFFVKTADCVVGPDEPIIYDPVLTKKLDGEVELAIVIGKSGRHIPVNKALEHVFGYTIVNDVTARDRQVRRRPDGSYWYELGRGKVFDTGAPLGPCIVTSDEVGDPQNLMVKSRVNGELRQISSTSQMIWSCAQLIHEFSVNLTLRPGMVIITGTPSGTAWSTDVELGGKWSGVDGMIPAKGYLQPGDVIECEIEGIGNLVNPIHASK